MLNLVLYFWLKFNKTFSASNHLLGNIIYEYLDHISYLRTLNINKQHKNIDFKGANVINLFSSRLVLRQNKLECLYFVS